MKRINKSIIAVALFVGIASSVFAADWYVDNQAAGAEDGTSWSDAFTDVSNAVHTVWGSGSNSGDTVYIRQADAAPNYSEKFTIGTGYADGTALAYNRIVGWTDTGYKDKPIISEQGSSIIVELGEAGVPRNFYEFKNLILDGGSYYYEGIKLYDTTSNVRCISNYFDRISFSADDGANNTKTNLLIQGNTFVHAHVAFRYGQFVQIIDNTMTETDGGRPVVSMNIGNFDFIISGNRLESGDCISSQNGHRISVYNNQMRAFYRACIWVDNYPQDWEIYNNIFYDTIGGHATNPNGIGIIFTRGNNKIYNNTFNNFPEAGSQAIVLQNLSVNTTKVFNNTISGVSTGIVSYVKAGTVTTNDYNNFWNVGTKYEGIAIAGANDKALDPDFVDSTNTFNFALQNELLMDSATDSFAGVNAPTDDFNGDLRTVGKIAFGAIESDVSPKGTLLIVR